MRSSCVFSLFIPLTLGSLACEPPVNDDKGATDSGAADTGPGEPGDTDTDTDTDGCTDPEACNYDERATVDDGSCEMPGALCWDGSKECRIFDCAGGDGSLWVEVIDKNNLRVMFSISRPILGFEFALSGVTLMGISGGYAAANGLTLSTNGNTAVGFSFSCYSIDPVTDKPLVKAAVQGAGPSCLHAVTFTGSDGTQLDLNVGSCVPF